MYKVEHWCWFPVVIKCLLDTWGYLRKVIGTTQVDRKANLNIRVVDIPTPPVDAAVETWQLEQYMWQVLERLVKYMEEQVKCIKSLVQDKMPTNPREKYSIPQQ